MQFVTSMCPFFIVLVVISSGVRDEEKDPRFIGLGNDLAPMDTMAKLLIEQTPSGGIVSDPRKHITVKLALAAIFDELEGDFVETGVYTGGTSILMAKVLATYAARGNRSLWSCDSFKGLPKEDSKTASNAATAHNYIGEVQSGRVGHEGEYASSRSDFEGNIKANGLENYLKDGRIKILEGFFINTLPTAPISKISFLRLDGDIFVSTWQGLEYLYGKVMIGGYIYVDDYGSYSGCKNAVDKYRKEHSIYEPLIPVYEVESTGKFEAVWWRKLHHGADIP